MTSLVPGNIFTMKKLLLTLLWVAACKSADKAPAGGGGGGGLEMSSSSAACKKAMTCCEKMVEVQKGKASPEDVNLSCSGVAIAKTDAECDQFRQGYAASLESGGKAVPAECK